MKKEEFFEYFRNVPISINNLYGDPFFSLQTKNTFDKLESLKKSKHKGIVSIITKSEIKEEHAKKLYEYNKYLDLVILVSISGLSNKKEEEKGANPVEVAEKIWNRIEEKENG